MPKECVDDLLSLKSYLRVFVGARLVLLEIE
jgi:hypothetical protein